jgi:vitamin B12 transporter
MSAVFGSDAIGGVINLIPRHGRQGAFNASFNAAVGTFGALTGAAGADGTLGAFRYALTAEGYASDGHDLVPERMSTHTGDEDGAEMSALTGVFDLALGDRFTLDLLARHRQARADFDLFLFDASFNEFRADDPDLEIAENDLTLARLGATWTLSDALSLRATAGGMNQERAQADGGAVTDAFQGERRFADLTLDWRAGRAGALEDVAMVAGVAAEREEIDVAQGFGSPPPSFFTAAEQDQRSAFVTAQARRGALSLTGAVRADDYEGFGATAVWRIGGSVELSDAARLYAAYGTSFRAPTLYERFVSFGDPDLDPEHGEGWEIGADARFDRVDIALAYRRTEIEDLIDFGPFFTYENVELAEIAAAEARVAVRAADWLTLNAGYVHTDALDVLAGAPLRRRPEHAWSASVDVDHGAFTGRVSWRNVGERTDILYGDDGYFRGEGRTPGYDLVRASGAYAFSPHAEVYIVVENALDEAYEPVNAFAAAPRGVTVGLRAGF